MTDHIRFRFDIAGPADDPHRPAASVWSEMEDNVPIVTLELAPLWGQQQRFLSLAPGEAHKLGEALVRKAREIEARSRVARNSAELKEQLQQSVVVELAKRNGSK